MKQVKDLLAEPDKLQTNLTKSQEGILSKTVCPKVWVSALFKKFQARYGHKWVSAIDGIEELAVDEWSEQLSGVSGEQIKHGLDTWIEDWPPSSTEFRKCCLDEKDWQHKSAAYKDFGDQKKLTQLKASEDVANTEREKIKKFGISLLNRSSEDV